MTLGKALTNNRIISTALLVLALVVLVQPLNVGATGVAWSSPILIHHNSAPINVLPAALQGGNGTLWLAWQSNRYAAGTSRYDILYQTQTANTWSSEFQLTSSGMNASPALVQLLNGTILIFWTSNPTGTSCSPQCNLYYERYLSSTNQWSASTHLTTGVFNDSQSYASVGRDGTLWLVWTRVNTNCSVNPCSITKQLYYRTLKNNTWSPETSLTTDSNWNSYSSVLVGKDSVVRVVWNKSPVSSELGQIYYRTYNGTAWSSETQIVSSSSSDENPSIIQDRNGTFWIFWGRKLYYNSLNFQYVLYNKFSFDVGHTWSSENQMTNLAQNVDSKMPFAVQANSASSRAILVFYSSNYLFNTFDIYALQSSYVFPIHDVTISQISACPTTGSSGTISVTVINLGDYSETVSLTVTLANKTQYTFRPYSVSVPIGGSTNVILGWISSTLSPGSNSVIATVEPVPGETVGNQGDNSLTANNVIQVLPIPQVSGASGGDRPYPV